MKLHEITGRRFPATREEVILACTKYNIVFSLINADLTVVVEDDVTFSNHPFSHLPIKFAHAGGNFAVFDCAMLTNFEGFPPIIGRDLSVSGCGIISLEGIGDIQVNDECWFDWNKIKHGGLGLLLTRCKRLFDCRDSPPFNIIRKYIRKGEDGLIECQSELIEAGFEEYAVL